MSVGGFLAQGVVHVHPSLRCNLACAHCYSTSSPRHAQQLAPDAILTHLDTLAQDGYEVLSVSGGEPLLYSGLRTLSEEARRIGFKVHVITNGFAVSARQLRALTPHLDMVAVSIDGDEERHDALRRSEGSYRRAVDSLRRFRDSGVRVAVVSCVTKSSLPLVPALHELCAREEVSLLSLRPVVDVGRAASRTGNAPHLTAPDLLRLKMVSELLDNVSSTRVRADVAFSGDIRDASNGAYPFLADVRRGRLAENVNPLVITEGGSVIPYVYGVKDSYALGNISDRPADLSDRRIAWLSRVKSLMQRAVEGLPGNDHVCVDWFAEILHHSRVGTADGSA